MRKKLNKINLKRILSSAELRFGVGLGLSSLCLYLALQNISYQDVWQVITQANLTFVSLALMSVAANSIGKTIRWRILLGKAGQKVAFPRVFMALLVGQLFNTALPGRFGDLSRAYLVGGLGPGRIFTLGTVILEKLFDLMTFALLFCLLLLLTPLPTWVSQSAYSLIFIALLIFLSLSLLVFYREQSVRSLNQMISWLPQKLQAQITQYLHGGLASLNVLHRPEEILQLIFWSCFIVSTAILTNQLTLLALQIQLQFRASILLLLGLQVGITLSSVPGTIGVFEYACVLILALFKVDQATAFSYGVLLHSLVLLPTTFLGLFFFWLLGLSGEKIDRESLSYANRNK